MRSAWRPWMSMGNRHTRNTCTSLPTTRAKWPTLVSSVSAVSLRYHCLFLSPLSLSLVFSVNVPVVDPSLRLCMNSHVHCIFGLSCSLSHVNHIHQVYWALLSYVAKKQRHCTVVLYTKKTIGISERLLQEMTLRRPWTLVSNLYPWE